MSSERKRTVRISSVLLKAGIDNVDAIAKTLDCSRTCALESIILGDRDVLLEQARAGYERREMLRFGGRRAQSEALGQLRSVKPEDLQRIIALAREQGIIKDDC